MTSTFHLVIAGDNRAARAASIDALQNGQRILLVLHSSDASSARRLRRALRRTAGTTADQIAIVTGVDVVCVDGIGGVEVVLIRHVRTGRLRAVNASAYLSFGTE